MNPIQNYAWKEENHFLIVGGGIAGLASAIGVRKSGFPVTVLEQMPEIKEIGAGIQLPPNLTRVLRQWGLLDSVLPLSTQPSDIFVRSYRDGSILSTQNLSPYCFDEYGAPYLQTERVEFHAVLLAEAQRLGVTIQLGVPVVKIELESSPIIVHTHGGRIFTGDFVLGCDGERSICRKELLGGPEPPQRSGDIAYRMVMKAGDLKVDPELEGLLYSTNLWFGPQSHVIAYPLKSTKKEDRFNIFLGGPDKRNATDKEIFPPTKLDVEEMRGNYAGWDPRLTKLLELIQPQESGKWTLLQSNNLFTWLHPWGRFVLLGDAAHAMLPYLGQGAAVALEDAAFLAEILSQVRCVDEMSDCLTILEASRRPRATEISRRSREMRGTHGYQDGPLQKERDRQLALPPFEGQPNPFKDPVFRPWLWGYDAVAEAHKSWGRYQKGEFPGTRWYRNS